MKDRPAEAGTTFLLFSPPVLFLQVEKQENNVLSETVQF